MSESSFTCKLQSTGAVKLVMKGGTREGTDSTDSTEPDWGEELTLDVDPKLDNSALGRQFDFIVERTGVGFPPVRATLHVTVDNNQQSG